MLQALCVPSLARALGWAGIIPFVALSLSAVFTIGSISQIWAMDALALYGAVILSFLGGAVWGLTLGHEGEALRPGAQGLLIGIAASLAGFCRNGIGPCVSRLASRPLALWLLLRSLAPSSKYRAAQRPNCPAQRDGTQTQLFAPRRALPRRGTKDPS